MQYVDVLRLREQLLPTAGRLLVLQQMLQQGRCYSRCKSNYSSIITGCGGCPHRRQGQEKAATARETRSPRCQYTLLTAETPYCSSCSRLWKKQQKRVRGCFCSSSTISIRSASVCQCAGMPPRRVLLTEQQQKLRQQQQQHKQQRDLCCSATRYANYSKGWHDFAAPWGPQQ